MNHHSIIDQKSFAYLPKAVDVRDGQALAEGDDQQRDRSGKVVKQREDVISGPLGETQRQQGADRA